MSGAMVGNATTKFTSSLTGRRLAFALLGGTMLAGMPAIATAQEVEETQEPAEPTPALPQTQIIQSIAIVGAERLEPTTILSYITLRAGQEYTQAAADQAIKELYATELFANASLRNDGGNVVIELVENPVVNRIILEGNKRLKNDKILPEIKLFPRQIFTRSKVRADTARIVELYKRQGRFAAVVEPKIVELSQNRVDVVYEISEGPKSKVRQINIIGNDVFSDGELRGEMVTKQARLTSFFSSNTSYDPDRLAFDQQKLRQFYLTNGYADFRVVSAVAELTPDKKDFIITYVVEEGERYKFGDVAVESQIRDFDSDSMSAGLPMKEGNFYDAKLVEDTVEQLTELAGTFGYAFADVRPNFTRNKDDLTMDVTFILNEAPRVYIERIDVNGNTLTQDKVVRREFRVAEGDPFNSIAIKRSTNRIKSLGFFQENFEIEQKEGSQPDRIILEANVEEQPTGELQLSAGFSSIESFILAGSIRQRNFRGRGQTVGASVNYSRFSRSANLSFSEPYVFDRNISAGVDIYRRDFNNFGFNNQNRRNNFEQSTTGFSARLGVPLSEYLSLVGSYTLNYDDISVSDSFFGPPDENGFRQCIGGLFLCEVVGKRTSSILGATLAFNNQDSRFRPTRGMNVSLGAEFAGLGGSVKYARVRGKVAKFWNVFDGFIFSLTAEGGAIKGLENREGAGVDDVRLNDRFFLGEPQFRGFDIRGVGPRVIGLRPLPDDGDPNTPREFPSIDEARADRSLIDDAIGGNAYYLARAELEIPLGSGARELGLRPSIFVDAGSLFSVTTPVLRDQPNGTQAINANGDLLFNQRNPDGMGGFELVPTTDAVNPDTGEANAVLFNPNTAIREIFLGDTAKPRVTAGVGVNWNSPFGPFRIDFAQTIISQPGDDTKRFTFNVGTQF
ncbi:MAG: outer membrane protein assembly factor BamA [Pontixanthobacter sp.]